VQHRRRGESGRRSEGRRLGAIRDRAGERTLTYRKRKGKEIEGTERERERERDRERMGTEGGRGQKIGNDGQLVDAQMVHQAFGYRSGRARARR